MNAPRNPSRRRFVQAGGAAALGLVVPLHLAAKEAAAGEAFAPNAFIRIAPDDSVTLVAHRSEMGQGIRTTLAMILCDELDADWSRVHVERATGAARYGDQNTVGDASLFLGWTPLRTAAATAREMLVAAAGRAFGVPAQALHTEGGRVVVTGSQPLRALRYGELATRAALQPVPTAPRLKTRAQYRLIGTPQSSVDLRAQTTGRMVYGIDVVRPGMRYAVLVRAPLPNTRLKAFDAAGAKAVAGVLDVFAVPGVFAGEGATYDAVAIVGRDSWSCLKARRVLKVDWDAGPTPAADSATIRARMAAAADRPGLVYRSGGDLDAMRSTAATTLKRRYTTPFLTHATLEPPNCTADVRADRCEVWAPTQNPGDARERIAEALQLPLAQVTVNVTDIGGGYGRKSMHDFVLEAVRVSRHVGAPVKLFWTREDDLRHGYYRSASLAEMEAGWDAQGELLFWRHHSVHSSQQPTSDNSAPTTALDPYELSATSALRFPYLVPAVRFEGTHVETPLKRAWMRGVQESFHAFASNCFLDEVAAATRRDPIAMRLALLGPPRRIQFYRSNASTAYWQDTARMAGVMQRAAALADWQRPRPAGLGRGFATHSQSVTYVAMVAEVRALADGGFQVERIVCVVDCGLVINPDAAQAQVQGAILYGLASCLYGEITLKDGQVTQSNFHDYPVARIADTPQMQIEFIASDSVPTGLGEPCVPLVAPAVANAIANAGLPRPLDWPLRTKPV